jgi:uncharacterized phage-associated protein
MKNDRLGNTVLYLLRGCKEPPGLTKLLKLLYFADYHHYRNHLKTITGASYVALARGPVVDGYKEEFDALERRGFMAVRPVPVMGHPDNPKQEFLRIGEPAPDAFAPEERATLDDVLLKYGDGTGLELSDLTHLELTPWKLVWNEHSPGAPIPLALFRWLDNYANERDVERARQRSQRPDVAAAIAEAKAAG